MFHIIIKITLNLAAQIGLCHLAEKCLLIYREILKT